MDHDVVPMVADLTDNDPVILTFMFAYDKRVSIPFYLVIPGDESKPAIVLPDNFTSGAPIIEGIGKASL